MQTVTSEDFDKEVTESKVPVICDFSATWCGPCRSLKPVMQDLDATSDGKYKVVLVDIDESQDLASRFGISAVPTTIIIKSGVEVHRHLGVGRKDEFLDMVK